MPTLIERVECTEPLSERLPEEIFNRINLDLVAASMCWENVDGAGVFDTETASAIAFNLCHYIADKLAEARYSKEDMDE